MSNDDETAARGHAWATFPLGRNGLVGEACSRCKLLRSPEEEKRPCMHKHEYDDLGECECGEHEGRGFSSKPPPYYPEPVFEPRIKHDAVRWGIDAARKIGQAFNMKPEINIEDQHILVVVAAVTVGSATIANTIRKALTKRKRKEKKR